MIRQALINLLLNALQAMPGGGSVVVSASRERREGRWIASVEVADDGRGMSEETTARLFQPFFTTKAQGTGLGLAVVRRFVEAHGGRVAVRSSEGHGSTFTLLLPLEAPLDAASEPGVRQGEVEEAAGAKARGPESTGPRAT
jgi:signal transduction histidine kinase